MTELSANGLRQARRATGLTQAELATSVGVSRKTINTIEKEVFVPSTVLALRLSEFLNLPVEALFSLSVATHTSKPQV